MPTVWYFWERLRRSIWIVVAVAILGFGLGAAVKWTLPSSHTATTQLLFDPRGLKIFSNEITTGHIDANAAVNHVESQMGILQSEGVLSRVIRSECALRRGGKGGDVPAFGFTAMCPSKETGDISHALRSLQQSIGVRRMERSFLVDVTAKGPSPEGAARLANEVVRAYNEADAENRARAAGRLTSELGSRLEELRKSVKAAETRADVYRRDQNLIKVGDRLLVDQRLAAATTSLSEAQGRLDKAAARMKLMDHPPRTLTALGTLGAEADTRTLLTLIERRNTIAVEIAPMSARVGARHPVLLENRSRLQEVDRSIAAELSAIRRAAQADHARAEAEHATLSHTVADLTARLAYARQAEIDLKTLDHEAEAGRKLLDSFELRAREAAEYGRVDAANLRVVSVAQAPDAGSLLPRLVIWGILGAMLAVMLAIGGVILSAMSALWKADFLGMGQVSARAATPAASPVGQMRMQAETFARYRYG